MENQEVKPEYKKTNNSLGKLFSYVKYPIFTEKSSNLQEKGFYTFIVDHKLKKCEMKFLFEKLFDVKLEKIRTIILRQKSKRVGKTIGKTSKYKKAILKLKTGYSLNNFFNSLT